MVGRGVFFCAVAVAAAAAPLAAEPPATAPTAIGIAARFETAGGRPDVAPWLVPDEWFGRPASPRPLRAWQQKKSPMTAMVSSFLVPGLGQLYNEREFWALVAAGVEFYFIGSIVSESREMDRVQRQLDADPMNDRLRAVYVLHRDNRIQSSWLLGVSIFLSGLQAFVDAHLFDFDDSPLPLEVGPLPAGGGAAALRLRF